MFSLFPYFLFSIHPYCVIMLVLSVLTAYIVTLSVRAMFNLNTKHKIIVDSLLVVYSHRLGMCWLLLSLKFWRPFWGLPFSCFPAVHFFPYWCSSLRNLAYLSSSGLHALFNSGILGDCSWDSHTLAVAWLLSEGSSLVSLLFSFVSSFLGIIFLGWLIAKTLKTILLHCIHVCIWHICSCHF